MDFEPLFLTCECGRLCSVFVQVGLTHDHRLVFHWWCGDCDKPVYVCKPLAECWRECPNAEDSALPQEKESILNSDAGLEDFVFLGTMGIRMPDDVE